MAVRVLTGDCRDIMRAMESDSVDCIVTSPPYWGLRNYGIAGQLGLEASLGEHIATMVDVFEAARRVLKKSGTLWLNYGDCYAASVNGRAAADTKAVGNDDHTFRDKPFSTVGAVLKPKDLCMVSNRLAIALQEAGWWVRSEIIWHKPNPMPESTRDRPTSAHEKIYLLAKSERYFYDAEAIAEKGTSRETFFPATPQLRALSALGNRNDGNSVNLQPALMRNKRNVWTVPSSPFSDAHFATFPPALIEPCILAGCPAKVCAKCGKPWMRQVEYFNDETDRIPAPNKGRLGAIGERAANMTRDGFIPNREKKSIANGSSPSCHCHAAAIPGTVLDPFGGAGTTGLVADRLGRNAILIELNPAYAAMAMNRVTNDLPLFAEVTAQ